VEDIGDGEADRKVNGRVDEALAEFFQMFYEAHAGEFGASEGGAGTPDEIIHESQPRSKHHLTSVAASRTARQENAGQDDRQTTWAKRCALPSDRLCRPSLPSRVVPQRRMEFRGEIR